MRCSWFRFWFWINVTKFRCFFVLKDALFQFELVWDLFNIWFWYLCVVFNNLVCHGTARRLWSFNVWLCEFDRLVLMTRYDWLPLWSFPNSKDGALSWFIELGMGWPQVESGLGRWNKFDMSLSLVPPDNLLHIQKRLSRRLSDYSQVFRVQTWSEAGRENFVIWNFAHGDVFFVSIACPC